MTSYNRRKNATAGAKDLCKVGISRKTSQTVNALGGGEDECRLCVFGSRECLRTKRWFSEAGKRGVHGEKMRRQHQGSCKSTNSVPVEGESWTGNLRRGVALVEVGKCEKEGLSEEAVETKGIVEGRLSVNRMTGAQSQRSMDFDGLVC